MIKKLKSIGNHLYSGIALLADTPTHNGRIYPLHELRKAADGMNQKLQKASVFGELGLNDGEILKINIGSISHKIDSVKIHDNSELEVVIETMATPQGLILKKMLDVGADLFLWMRAYGIVSNTGLVSALEFSTWDVDVMQNLRAFDMVDNREKTELFLDRIKQAPERRIFYIDVKDMPPEKAKEILDDIYNPRSLIDDYFFPKDPNK
jgi:Bacteriophage T4-like portal protein (Gp20)